MSDHEWARENLDAYVAGGLPANERGRIEQHLAACAECTQALTQARRLESSMAELFADARPDAKMEERMIHRLRKVRPPRRWPAWTRFAVGAAAMVLLGLVGAIVQAVATGGVFPDGRIRMATAFRDGRSASPVQSADRIKGIKAAAGVDPAATDLGLDVQYMNERADEAPKTALLMDVSGSMREVNGKLAATEGKTISDEAEKRPLAYRSRFKVEEASRDQGKAEKGKPAGKDHLDIPEGYQAIGLPVNLATTSHGLASLPGSRANLILTIRGSDAASASSRVVLQDALVLSADGRTDREGEMVSPASVVTFALSPKDALAVSLAKELGTLSLSMRKPNDHSSGPGHVVTGLDILDRKPRGGEPTYFKPADSPALTPPPALPEKRPAEAKEGAPEAGGAGASPDGGGPPKGTNPPPGLITSSQNTLPVATQPKADPPADRGLKIIRTGEMEFEVASFDKAVDATLALIKPLETKGAFMLTKNSEKQSNGKTRGKVIVRMKPENLSEFMLNLRRDLGKMGELRSEQIGSQDVTKQYTDTESELRAARAAEKGLLAIIEKGKGEVKDLVLAEKELGLWRMRIEKMEGEIRYYANQVALSTLTINLVEKEITAASALVVNATVKMRIEVDHVTRARETIEKAVEDFKGRIVKSDEKQYPAGQVEAIVHAEIPPDKKDAFRKTLEQLGIVSAHEDAQTQTTEGGSGPVLTPRRRVNDVVFQITLNNIVNIKPKHSVKLDIVTTDVRGNFEKLKDEIVRVFKGQIWDAKLDENQDKQKAIAVVNFSVPIEKKAALDKLLAAVGPTLDRTNTQAAITEISTEQKFGYQLALFSVATVEPREKVRLHIEVSSVEHQSAEIADLVKEAKGQVNKPKSGLNRAGQTEALLVINVPLAFSDRLVRDIKATGIKVIDWAQAPNPSVPDNGLATAQVVVLLTGPDPSIPVNEGLSAYASKSLYVSYTVFVYCVVTILAGISFILPWAAVIYVGVWLFRRVWSKPATAPAAVSAAPAAPEPPKPANP